MDDDDSVSELINGMRRSERHMEQDIKTDVCMLQSLNLSAIRGVENW